MTKVTKVERGRLNGRVTRATRATRATRVTVMGRAPREKANVEKVEMDGARVLPKVSRDFNKISNLNINILGPVALAPFLVSPVALVLVTGQRGRRCTSTST